MNEAQSRGVSRRNVMKSTAWSVPVIAASIVAPTSAASGITTCYSGSWGPTFTSKISAPVYTSEWVRYDVTVTITNEWTGTYSDMFITYPFGWSGPAATGTAGPFNNMVWDDAAGQWVSIAADNTNGSRFYFAEYGTLTPAPRAVFEPFTNSALYPDNPASTSSGWTPIATVSKDSSVFTWSLPGTLGPGASTTFKFSRVVSRILPTTGHMQTRWEGYFMSKACEVTNPSGRRASGGIPNTLGTSGGSAPGLDEG